MEKFTFFWQQNSPFSQWFSVRFTVNNQEFNCCEQYMMYQKALLFGDHIIASEILKTKYPKDQKKLGRKVKNFSASKWEAVCKQIVYDGNYAKFSQNPALKQILLATKGTTLAEASPLDRIWGIGLSDADLRTLDRTQWLGTNWLGEILTQLREDLMKENN
jgi:ribA/ribD-fused uncharacterized protein